MTSPLKRRQVLGLGLAGLAVKVFGGLGGALVVCGDLDRIPEGAAASETVLVLKDFASATGTAEAGMGMGGGGMGAGGMGFVINGQLFHLHINPFQVISRDGLPEAQRRWKDTVPVRSGAEVRLRVSFRDSPGRTLYECHNLDHEDLGLMGVLQIDGQAG